MREDSVLKIEAMHKLLESGSTKFMLDVRHFNLRRGLFYGVVGKSGSGKSTLLDLLSMVSAPSEVKSFNLNVDGKDVDLGKAVMSGDDEALSDIRLRYFGYVLQSGGLLPFLSVRENIRLPFDLAGRQVSDSELHEHAGLFDMAAHLDKKPSGLSGGQRQRVSILRALALRPSIVLADEPTAAVDEGLASRIVEEFKRLAREQNVTVVMVSHDIELVSSVADRILTLKPETVAHGQVSTTVDMFN